MMGWVAGVLESVVDRVGMLHRQLYGDSIEHELQLSDITIVHMKTICHDESSCNSEM